MEGTFLGMVAYAEALVAANPNTHWMPKQFTNGDNPHAHYTATGPEIWNQSGGEVDVFVAGAGAGKRVESILAFSLFLSLSPFVHRLLDTHFEWIRIPFSLEPFGIVFIVA